MAITIKTIDELLTGNFEDSSPIMFGIGTNIFKTTWGDLKADIVGQNVSEISYQLLTDNRIVEKQLGDDFLANRDATIGSGQLTFIQFKVIYEDSSLGLNTYLIPLGEGVYNPLGNSISFSDLILIDRVATDVSIDDGNTTTYTFAEIAEINEADPSIDFTDIDRVYFVLLGGTLFHFVGANGMYGINDLQMSLNDLDIVKASGQQPTGLEAIDEGNGTGWRLIGRDPSNYGNIGVDAIDLSTSLAISTTRGASGNNSYAEGNSTEASGNNSHAEGRITTASGFASHAEGNTTLASGSNSHAQGRLTTAIGDASHAEGKSTEASGNNSHAEGLETTAIGDASHAEGNTTLASGSNSHAEGLETTASGFGSHAEGNTTLASGAFSHAEGFRTTAIGAVSHAEGDSAEASGAVSHAEGEFTFARGRAEHSGGRYGTDYTPTNDGRDRLFNIGNGTATESRSDAFTIYRNGAVRFFSATLASITNSFKRGMFIINSEDNHRPYYNNGNAWKGLAYQDDDVILTSPNNTQYKLTVDDSGNLSTEII